MIQDDTTQSKLFESFPEVGTDAWEAVIEKDLKGGDYDKKLVWRTIEGFSVRPYYRRDDLKKLSNTDVAPGKFPFIRGNKATDNSWRIRQDFDVTDFHEANRLAVDASKRGANSIGYRLPTHAPVTAENIETLLQGLDPERIEVNFLNEGRGDFLFGPLEEALSRMGDAGKKLHGSIGFSQLTFLGRMGRMCKNHGGVWPRAARAVEFHKEHQNFQTLSVDGRIFHNAGATASQELGYTLAMAAEYMAQVSELGFSPADIAKAIRFNFAVGPTYFIEMAKFRAARLLWAQIVKSFGVETPEAAMMTAHAETSRWNQTVYDPYVNMLRGATESMSAVLAGVHSLTVTPFNAPYEEPTNFSNRIARNLQLLLRDECYFDKVVDPAGGSYYIETLTHSVAQAAWDVFLEVQTKGGFVTAFQQGEVQRAIKEVAATRRKRIATRRDTLLGTNQFPNFLEQAKPEIIEAVGIDRSETIECSSGAQDACEPLRPFRGADEFESLRFRTDSGARRPKAFMLALGNLAMRRARAQFSCNFFACAGIEVIDNIGFKSVEEGLDAARKAKSDIIVLCSSDDEYAELGPEVFQQIKPGEIFVVAGAPACQPDLEAIGIKHFISVRSNLLETLRQFQRELGIIA